MIVQVIEYKLSSKTTLYPIFTVLFIIYILLLYYIIITVTATLNLVYDRIQEMSSSNNVLNNKNNCENILFKINNKFFGYLSIYAIFQVHHFFKAISQNYVVKK